MKTPLSNAYFDLETLSLNPYDANAKIILAQLKYNGQVHLLKEWELGEFALICELAKLFRLFPKYTPVMTYNGAFDFSYLMGRVTIKCSYFAEKYHDIFMRNIKHCDLLQFDNGYFVPLWKICRKMNMPLQSRYDGKHMQKLYEKKEYDCIIEHGLEDVEILEKLVTETDIADRFLKTEILNWNERKWKK